MRGLPDEKATRTRSRRRFIFLGFALLITAAIWFNIWQLFSTEAERSSSRDFLKLPTTCPVQPDPLVPRLSFDSFITAGYREKAAERLLGAARVRTETFDNGSPDGADPSYEKFFEFEAYLSSTFPNVFGKLKLEHLATHGLLLTWQGSDSSLQPIILMAHQDTVPVPPETVDRWTYPAFEGHFDEDGWVWGRGTGDCKGLLIGELAAAEELLIAGFEPTRTVIFSFGFDEEGGSVHSASALSAHVESVYGKDSILFIVDEGEGIKTVDGHTFITPGLSEKGSSNVAVTVAVPGGHSSIPPAHTGIGILSSFVTTLEKNPFPFKLSAENPFSTYAQCLAEHTNLDPKLKKALAHERTWDKAAQIIASNNPADAARLSNTQAVDLVNGGVKVNALPEQVIAVINHRISIDSSVKDIQDRYVRLLTPEAKHFNLTVVGFNEEPAEDLTRYVKLSHYGNGFGGGASPVTPHSGDAWNLFAGTARHLYQGSTVSPFMMNGGTDTRAFWNLTRAIYRFQPLRASERVNVHTVDERVHIDGHLSTIRWIHALIQNADAFRA
ncbi:hypothetical protein C8J56DRAFT_964720 [Mycena floridula]|nr:hypothetical protein C8J56DRAFT_964720 [Mycena floridula]